MSDLAAKEFATVKAAALAAMNPLVRGVVAKHGDDPFKSNALFYAMLAEIGEDK